MSNRKLTVFLDTIGRTIIGEKTGETDDYLEIKNPVVINVVPQQTQDPNTGQTIQRMALQLFPVFFREFLADKEQAVVFNYQKKNITMSNDFSLEFKVAIQYDQLFMNIGTMSQNAEPAVASTATKTDGVIKLFDD